MGLYDLADRLNWQQAARLIGCSKTSFFRLVRRGKIRAYGMERCRFYLKSEVAEYMQEQDKKKAPA